MPPATAFLSGLVCFTGAMRPSELWIRVIRDRTDLWQLTPFMNLQSDMAVPDGFEFERQTIPLIFRGLDFCLVQPY